LHRKLSDPINIHVVTIVLPSRWWYKCWSV